MMGSTFEDRFSPLAGPRSSFDARFPQNDWTVFQPEVQQYHDPGTGMAFPGAMSQQPGPSEADAYRMGGLAGMENYLEGPPHATFGAYDKAMREQEREAAKLAQQPVQGPDYTGTQLFTGATPRAQQKQFDTVMEDYVVPSDALGAIMSLGGGTVARALGGVLLGASAAEAGAGGKLGGRAARGAGKALEDVAEAGVRNWRPGDIAAGVGGPSYLSPEDQLLFATRYPEAGKSTPKPKTNPAFEGETYPSKVYTDEENRLQAARDKVVADMKREGYTPYFDPAKRFDVNYKEYVRLFGQPEDTSAISKKIIKGGPPPLDMGSLDEAYRTGVALGQGPLGFYKMGQLEKPFLSEYGKDEGRRQFVNRFTMPMAATTAGMTPQQNLLLSLYGNFEREAGRQLPTDAAYKIPYPVGGGKYGATGNLQQYEDMLYPGASGINYLDNPKRYDFNWAFLGRRDRPVVDEQMMKGMTGKVQGAEAAKGGYGYYARPVIGRAGAFGIDPIQYQEVSWAGLKNAAEIAAGIEKGMTKPEQAAMAAAIERGVPKAQAQAEADAAMRARVHGQAFQGQPMITDVNEAIERTSRLLQIPPAEVVRRGFVRSQLPVYGLVGTAGAAGMGALVAPDRYDAGSL